MTSSELFGDHFHLFGLNVFGFLIDRFRFMRKGKVNSYKEEMPQEYIKKMDEEIRKWKEVNDLYSEK